MEPQIEGLEFHNHVVTGKPGSGDQAWVYAAPGSTSISVHGSLPPGQNSFRIKAAIPDPDLAAAQQLLKACSWEHLGQIRTRQDLPAEKRPLASVESSPLPVMLEEMLARSINGHAEHLLRHSGREVHGGDPEEAAESMLYWLTELGAENHGCRIVDGSGLSRSNLVSTHFMAISAQLMLEQSWGDSLFQILPENGRDGTLRRVLPSSPGRIRAKTGTLDGVRGYAGYLIGESGGRYAFCLLVNHHEGGSSAARSRLDPLLASLISLP
jgi:D-alanyl-D-alanine carboxypeptidase/D-alanyl-D-alanine-endopeptidase (penicillin-binding protein 4)